MIFNLGFFMVGAVLLGQTDEQSVRLEAMRAALVQLQPVALDARDDFSGTFFLASDYLSSDDGSAVPFPCNIRPGAPTYLLRDGYYLVDDVAWASQRMSLRSRWRQVAWLRR